MPQLGACLGENGSANLAHVGLKNGSGEKLLSERLLEASAIDMASGCRVWARTKLPSGYGKLNVEGRQVYAHRASWAVANGPIPAGMFVCHRCDNPSCINPDHLFLGTAKDNAVDRDRKGRGRMPHVRGEAHGQAKLTAEQVLAIRASEKTQRVIAAEFGVAQITVSDIRRGKNWGHV